VPYHTTTIFRTIPHPYITIYFSYNLLTTIIYSFCPQDEPQTATDGGLGGIGFLSGYFLYKIYENNHKKQGNSVILEIKKINILEFDSFPYWNSFCFLTGIHFISSLEFILFPYLNSFCF
jgi:hypothetical protein